MIGKRLLNDGWSFTKMPVGSTREQALKADWKRVQLPHDWLIWQTENLYESADAWYSRKLSWQDAKAPCILLRFNGVYMDCDVLLNGENGEAYNIADESGDITLRDLAALVAAQAGRKVIFELPNAIESAGFSKATKARLDGRKIKELGWKPAYDLQTGVSRSCETLAVIAKAT